MQITNTEEEWGGVAQLFHWTMAAVIFAMMVLGWVMVYWPQSPTQLSLFAWHKSVGVTIFALMALRLLWRLTNSIPALPADMPRWERGSAHAVHALLYLILFAMPVSGYVINSAADFPLAVFGLFTIPNVTPSSEALQHVAETAHLTFFWILASVLAVHIAGALRHHLLLRDGVLWRMLPGRRGQTS